jgi:ecotin
MMRLSTLLPLLLALLFAGACPLSAFGPLEAFPDAEPDEVRHVLELPPAEDESLLRVELIVGKEVETDPLNHYFFGGRLKERVVEGWGYSYYRLEELGPMAGTLMAVDPEAPMVRRFIPLGGEPGLLRYNSRLPLVVYLPEGVELRYRVWSAGEVVKGSL